MSKKTNASFLRLLGPAAAVLLAFGAGQAYAGPYEFGWVTDSGGTGNSAQRTFTDSDGFGHSSTLKARAYATSNNDGTGNFVARNLGIYTGGLGVDSGTSLDPNTTPDHSMDNVGPNDVILFEFDAANYNPTGLTIGWRNNDSDLQVWIGGGALAAGLNLTSYSGCSGSVCDAGELAALGFTLITAGLNDLTENVERTLSTSLTGRYMIVAGRFNRGDEDDYVKISGLAARVPQQQVPEPGVLGLLGAGLAALGWSRRRKTKVA